MNRVFTLLILWLVGLSAAIAQTRILEGTVLDKVSQSPIAGATIKVQNSTISTSSNYDGAFSLTVPNQTITLTISSVGYNNVAQNISTTEHHIQLFLEPQEAVLDQVVVTALGVQRKAKSLTYATQEVKGDELTKVKDANPMNNLTGKVSGVQINRSASGIGGSVNIVLRGFKSNRSNQPLFVIDGLPIANTEGSGATGPFGGGADRGDILSALNADDIQSINVLKGASASALYGSQGANGAIMITTKKGAEGSLKIDLSSGFNVDQAFYLPKLQTRYGQTTATSEESWGAPGQYENPLDDFFETGTTFMNTVALSGGTQKMQNYFSYANTANKGVLPTNTFDQHSATFRNSTNFFDNKLLFDGSLMYSRQDIHNRASTGLYFSPIAGAYLFPRGLDFEQYKNFEYYSNERNLHLQDWWNINADKGLTGTHNQQNPYWVLHRNPTDQKRDNIIGQAQLRFSINDWLSISARGTFNKRWDKWNRNVYAGTQGILSGEVIQNVLPDNGRFDKDEGEATTMYGDFLFIGNKQLSADWELNFTAGTSINDIRSNGWSITQRKLTIANVFLLSNIYRSNPINSINEYINQKQIQSVFSSANIGFKQKLYLDLTARNDWSSTLANTPKEKSGYFYWSAGLSAVLSDIIQFPAFINYSKLRLSYAQVGNDVAPYSTIPTNTLNSGNLNANITGAYQNLPLKPELSQSIELGYETRFWNDRVNFDFTIYRTRTKDQYFSYDGPVGMTATTVFLNAGNVENKGIEASLAVDAIRKDSFKWNTGFNFTANRNKILALAPNLGERYAVGGNYNVIRLGGSFGDFWGPTFRRNDEGILIVDDNGRPQMGPEGYLGNNTPKFITGWNNNFSYRNVGLSFTIDARFGGQVISGTQGFLNSYGVSEESAVARDLGGVNIKAVKTDGTAWNGLIPAQAYYTAIGNRDGILEGQTYDATNIRMREISLHYKIPLKTQSIKQLQLALTGRNLFFLKNEAPYDPELNTTTATGGQGYDIFMLPTTRSYGLNLKLSF